jgi:hypothetical protein
MADEARILAISKGYSASPLRRSPGQFFMDAVGDFANRASPQALLRYLTRNLTDTEMVDPATGERIVMSGIGSQLRRDELERRDRYALMERADPWNAPDLNWFERALRGGAGVAGAFVGSAGTDPLNYVGAPGVGSTIGATARNVGINAGVGTFADAAGQALDVGSGVQDQFSVQQALASGALNAFLPTAIEGAAMGVNRMLPQPAAPAAAPAPARGGPAVPQNPAAQRPSQQAAPEVRIDLETGRPYITKEVVDITPAEADALVAAGTYRRDPATGAVYRYVGATDQAPAASLPDVEVTAAAPGAVERMPMQGDAPQGAQVVSPPDAPVVAAVTDAPLTLYHGSAADFDKFDLAFMGSGEGGQGRGLGFYFSTQPEVAKYYVDKMRTVGREGPGVEYEVTVPNGKFIDWDVPILQQPDVMAVAPSLVGQRWLDANPEATARQFMNAVANSGRNANLIGVRADRAAVAQLREQGFIGTVHSDALTQSPSLGGGAGQRNYAVFDPRDITIQAKNGVPTAAARTLAEDVGAPGRTPDEVLLGPVVRGLDDEFGIPQQPSPAVARAAEADLTLRAPDEPRAPDARAGNLLLNKFDSTLDVATVLETADTAAGGFAEARRAPQSFAQTEALAEQLGMTADELLKRPNGTAFNAEQSQAARNLLVASAEKVDAIAARIAEKGDPGEDLLNEFRDTVLRHVAIQEQVAGVVAEAGRALGILRNRASSVNITADMLDAMMAGKGPAGLQRAARNIVEAGKKNPRERAKAIEKAYKATGFDVFLEYWYNAILSGPWTHLYNVMSTGANVLNNLPVTAGAAAIGAAKKLTGVQWGVERDRVLGSEVYARGVGLLTGAVDGARAFGHTMMTGGVSDNVDRLDTQVRRAIPGALGTVIRTPSRLLSAEDEFFKATARRMQLNAISLRMAHAEGLRGDAMTARAAELAKNPTEYLSAEADNFARYLTFQTEMGPGGRGILRTLDAWPASRIVVPFVRTPINLMKTTVEHSPFAPLLTEWRDDVKAGGARADVALAKMAVGMGYGVAIATAAGYGMVTGAAPADKTERQALEATGWKPFSIRVGDTYVDYRRMDPFSSILGIAATLGQPQTPHGKPVDLASAFVSGFLGQLTDKTFLTGLSDFVAAASDETGSKLEAWVKRFAGSFVPALASQTAQIIDPSKRVTETLADTMQSRIPGMSQGLPAQRDILGDPLRTFSPVTPVENDRAAAAIVSTGARIGELGKTLQGRKLTGQEYDAYERLAGQYLREGIGNWIDTPDWLEMDDEGRREIIEELADEAREDARQELGLDRPAE